MKQHRSTTQIIELNAELLETETVDWRVQAAEQIFNIWFPNILSVALTYYSIVLRYVIQILRM